MTALRPYLRGSLCSYSKWDKSAYKAGWRLVGGIEMPLVLLYGRSCSFTSIQQRIRLCHVRRGYHIYYVSRNSVSTNSTQFNCVTVEHSFSWPRAKSVFVNLLIWIFHRNNINQIFLMLSQEFNESHNHSNGKESKPTHVVFFLSWFLSLLLWWRESSAHTHIHMYIYVPVIRQMWKNYILFYSVFPIAVNIYHSLLLHHNLSQNIGA